jgi:diguanylate cyclase (GGDEF)-like protein
VILDVEMPHQSGIELCQAIRAHPRWQSLPVMFLTAHHQAETIQAVFTAGADDYITKPFVGAELLTRITNRLERTRLLRTLSTQDPLTGLMNQPCSLADLERMLQQAKQENHPFCLILLDLQGLKQINLQHGHWIGNQVLQLWGHLLQVTFHGQASLGYWCNGEFAIGIPHLTQAEVKQRFSHFFASLHQQIYTTPTGNCLHPLCQVAVVEFPCHGLTLQALYQSAHDSFMTTSESISRKQSHESVN